MDNSRGQPRLERMALNALLRWRKHGDRDDFNDMCDKADRLMTHNASLSALVRKIKRQMRNTTKPASPATEK